MLTHVVRYAFIGAILWGTETYGLGAADFASSYNLTHTRILPFPTSPIAQNDASNWILQTSQWGVSKINNNPQDVQFVSNPFTSANPPGQVVGSGGGGADGNVVLAVNYPQGSYSHDTGGIQFNAAYNEPGAGDFQSMMLSYEVAFDENFQFVKGGKLPGLRGGPQSNGCSGGNQPTGADCFSLRLMWRMLGSGEAYAYIPTPNDFCNESDVRCNSDGFGTSIDRATFSFKPGQWTRITMLITLNDPMYANGELWVYFNDLLAVRKQNVYYRATTDIASVMGIYFSTFFGGNDPSWASPVSQNTYYRNIQLWASNAPSNVTGGNRVASFSSGSLRCRPMESIGVAAVGAVVAVMALVVGF